MEPPSGLSISFTLLLPRALQDAGGSDTLIRAIIDDPAVASAAVAGAERYLNHTLRDDEARLRRDFMMKSPKDVSLSSRVINVLLRSRRIETIGDLCMCTSTDIRDMHNSGPKTVLEVSRLLEAHGLSLRSEYSSALDHAVSLYGDARYVPSKWMPLWASRLNGSTMEVLARYPTLGDLSRLSGSSFMNEEYYRMGGEPLSVCKNQMLKVRYGLQMAGLSMSSE